MGISNECGRSFLDSIIKDILIYRYIVDSFRLSNIYSHFFITLIELKYPLIFVFLHSIIFLC